MTYQILILVRDDTERPLWTYYMTLSEGATNKVIWETTDISELDDKVTELLSEYTASKIRVVGKIDYSIDVVIA